jgi:hypothetical protein
VGVFTEGFDNSGKQLFLYGNKRQNESQDYVNECGQEDTRLPGNFGKHIEDTFFSSCHGICFGMNYCIDIA